MDRSMVRTQEVYRGALWGFTAVQLAKAYEAILSGALQRVRPESSILWCRSISDPSTLYRVSQDRCSCPARRRCYHLAARILWLQAQSPP